MKLLLDECLPPAAAPLLRALGHEAIHIQELAMEGTPDEVIIPFAIRKGYIIATQDDDFSEIIALERLTVPSIIFLRLGPVDSQRATRTIHAACLKHSAALAAGCILTCDGGEMRARMLPVK